MWHGIVSGPALGVLAVLGWLGFCAAVSWHTDALLRPAGAERLSGRATFFLKFFGPYYLLAAWLGCSLWVGFSAYRADLLLPVSLFLAALLALTCWLAYRLRQVYRMPGAVLVGGYFAQHTIPDAEVLGHDTYGLLDLPLTGRLGLGRLRTRAGSYWYLLA